MGQPGTMTAGSAGTAGNAGPADDDRTDPVRDSRLSEVVDTFSGLMRSFGRTKARLMAAHGDDVEWSAQILLHQLADRGPMRASAIAECLQSDPSTVSRQVAALVKDGFLERRADADDGRASILVLTDKARVSIAEREAQRLQHFGGMLHDWTAVELGRFAVLLGRFADDFDKSSEQFVLDRTSLRHRPPEGTH